MIAAGGSETLDFFCSLFKNDYIAFYPKVNLTAPCRPAAHIEKQQLLLVSVKTTEKSPAHPAGIGTFASNIFSAVYPWLFRP